MPYHIETPGEDVPPRAAHERAALAGMPAREHGVDDRRVFIRSWC